MHYVYLLIRGRKHNNEDWNSRIFYVGITTDLDNRMRSHLLIRNNSQKNNIISKYGFFPLVLYKFDNREDAIEREIFLIDYFGRTCNKTGILSNITAGGEGNYSSKFRKFEIIKHLEHIRDNKVSIRSYAKLLNVNHHVILTWIKNYGIVNIKQANKLSEPVIKSIIDRYISSGISIHKYALTYNISYSNMKKWCRKYKCKTHSTLLDEEKILSIKDMFSCGISLRQISRDTGISRNAVRSHCTGIKL